MAEDTAVGEGDELGEGVRSLRAAEESGMATLRADKGGGFRGGSLELARGQNGGG